MKTFGGGERAFTDSDHRELSVSIIGRRFVELAERFLRAIAWMTGCDVREVKVVRMCDPCDVG